MSIQWILWLKRITGKFFLVITDHLEWENLNEHLTILEKKLSTYINVLESGRIFEGRENFRGKKFVLEVNFKYSPMRTGTEHINHVRPIVQSYGYDDLRCVDCSKE